ncbi:MAG: putative transport system permease protein, partial [Solirubrobacteraceae bacterium]|nr:putative transport system permease protein [Solirubrobacteraceae bacterium]
MIRFALKGLLGRKLRTALTAIAIVLGVAMISGTYVLTDSIDSAFNSIFTDSRKGSNVVISGKAAFDLSNQNGATKPTFDESLTAKVRALPGVQAAEPSVNGEAHLIGNNGKSIVYGGAPNLGFSIANGGSQFNPLTLVQGHWPGPGEVVVDESTAKKEHFTVGQQIGVQAEGPEQKLKIGGIVKFGSVGTIGGATLAGFDMKTAQQLFGKPGKLDEIAVAAKAGTTDPELIKQISGILPPNTQVRTSAEQATSDAKDTNSFITFLQGFLLAFAGIALFVGSFVIANSLSITIAQRTREFATIRTLGGSRRQVLWSIVLESLVVGILASLVGLFAGLGLAKGLFKLFDVVGFTLPNSGLIFQTRTIVVSLLIGIFVTLAASLRPALRATRVPPIAAVREGATLPESRFARFRVTGSLGLTGLGFAALLYGLFGRGLGTTQLLLWMGVGALLIFVGVALFSSRLVRPLAAGLGWPAARFGGAAGTLARDNARRNPQRTASTAAALMIG